MLVSYRPAAGGGEQPAATGFSEGGEARNGFLEREQGRGVGDDGVQPLQDLPGRAALHGGADDRCQGAGRASR